LIILLASGCTSNDKANSRNANENSQIRYELPSGGDIIEIDLYEMSDNLIDQEVRKISSRLGIVPLAKIGRSDEIEYRLWTNLGGNVDPKLLGVYSNRVENRGYFVDIKKDNDYAVQLRNDDLAIPNAGWNKMLFELRSKLTTPKGLVRDPQFSLYRDEPLILLEVLDKSGYRKVLYGKHSAFPDAKRLIATCVYLSAEFDVDLDCQETAAAPSPK